MNATTSSHTNRLAGETSPYLLQHAHNPVAWYPWGPEALERARNEDKPILLSVGYSACHWCHVMAHESFEDENTARIMNAHFINIKVDREERPDLDKIYQLAHQLLAQRTGGWPLTMFLTPDDHTPFYGGTYFPPERRHGMPAFTEVLERIAEVWREQRHAVQNQNARLREALCDMARPDPGTVENKQGEITPLPMTAARDLLERSYEPRHGGFGGAPKFPHPTNLERLLHHHATHADDTLSLRMVTHTLTAMAEGGMQDQLGGGFCRYSVDEQWMIPHFEKMLYDNGPLLALYTDAFRVAGEPCFRRTAIETAEWVLREMQAPEGGFYSSLDADSEGHEGRFYVWTPGTVQALLTPEEYALVAPHYGLDRPPNFEGEAWHLHIFVTRDALARRSGFDPAHVDRLLDGARAKLHAARKHRVHPGRDDKILTAWNALMIRGLARAGRFLDRPDFTDAAARAARFVLAELWRGGRLLATCRAVDGRVHAHLDAYLDDHAFLLDALLELLESRWDSGLLRSATGIADALLARFEDTDAGGFFFTSHDHEKLLQRFKPVQDEATPSGNGVAIEALLRLAHLTGDLRYHDAAMRALQALMPEAARYPHACGAMLNALERWLDPGQTIVLRGRPVEMAAWAGAAAAGFHPLRAIYAVPEDTGDLPPRLAAMPAGSRCMAWLCSGMTCQPPCDDLDAFTALLPR